jgi:hypothetical protein
MITGFLRKKGTEGATLQEIYAAVKAELGESTLDSSIRSILYKRLVGADSKYVAAFERFVVGRETRYRLMSDTR